MCKCYEACFIHWERCSRTFSSQALFISVFYINMQYECDNVFPNLICIPRKRALVMNE